MDTPLLGGAYIHAEITTAEISAAAAEQTGAFCRALASVGGGGDAWLKTCEIRASAGGYFHSSEGEWQPAAHSFDGERRRGVSRSLRDRGSEG